MKENKDYCYKGKGIHPSIDWFDVNRIKQEWKQEDNHTGMMGDYRLERHIEIGQLIDFVEQFKEVDEKIYKAIELAFQYGGIDGGHHKMWVIDQMIRILIDDENLYNHYVKQACEGEDGPNTYDWDTGIAP
jgi:hypothetical protein